MKKTNEAYKILQRKIDYIQELETNERMMFLLLKEKQGRLWKDDIKTLKEKLVFNVFKNSLENAQVDLLFLIDYYNDCIKEEAYQRKRRKNGVLK